MAVLTVRLIKRFGGLTAVDQMSFSLKKGEILAILGDNGAGKSTLIKMISGVYQADGGSVEIEGVLQKINNPKEAIELGIQTIYQDLALAENLNVYSNIFLGRERLKKRFGFINILDHDVMRTESEKVLKQLEIKIPSLESKIRNLSGGQRQSVAIARSIYWNAKILIMDEPTAALAVSYTTRLKI